MRVRTLLFTTIFLTSCAKPAAESWEDVKTASRYMTKNMQTLFGFAVEESRLLLSNQDFIGPDKEKSIALADTDLQKARYNNNYNPTQTVKTQNNRQVKSLSGLFDATQKCVDIFPLLHFASDCEKVTEKKDLITIEKIAQFLQKNPNAHLVIEGHCDQIASVEYNTALGMRRAQEVELLLINKGVNPKQIYTISYGKDKPIIQGCSKDALRLNRRAAFKVFMEK